MSEIIKPQDIPYRWIKDELTLDKTYKKGDKRGKVKIIQEWLSFQGPGLLLDGDFGPNTEKAVKKFQEDKGLPADGKVNADTFIELVKPALRALTPVESENLSYSKLITLYAEQHLAEHPLEIGGNNKGPWVRMYMGGYEGIDWPWCAGFATFILKLASDNSDYSMPFDRTFSCDLLATSGKDAKLFIPGKNIINGNIDYSEIPTSSIFLVRRTGNGWSHTGLVTKFDESGVETIEGNTNDEGSREGYEVCKRYRGYTTLDFVKVE
jgi:hypothetical protein